MVNLAIGCKKYTLWMPLVILSEHKASGWSTFSCSPSSFFFSFFFFAQIFIHYKVKNCWAEKWSHLDFFYVKHVSEAAKCFLYFSIAQGIS